MESPAQAHVVGVVDDDPTCTVVLQRILSHAGYAVKVYASGESVLAAVATDPLDVVCLDLSLPGIDGIETLRRLKAGRPTLPVILFTAAADEIASQAMEAGAFACVPKTGNWAELREAVAAALADRT